MSNKDSGMKEGASSPRICRSCGATLSPVAEFCQTCHIIDQWMLAVETSNLDSLREQIKPDQLLLVIQYIKRLRDRVRQPRIKSSKRKTPQEFDFALQEIEKTTRGLELTSIEAVGVLEMVKQSFVEEMFYEDYRLEENDDDDDDDS
jgi:ribosomal protein L40E